MSSKPTTLTGERIEQYEEVQSQLTKLYDEIEGLAKKKPDAPLNRFKVDIINERLRAAKVFLKGIHKPFEAFEQFDEAELPSASDAAVVLSQFLNSLEGWRSAHVVVKQHHGWCWNVSKGVYPASAPTRFKKKSTE